MNPKSTRGVRSSPRNLDARSRRKDSADSRRRSRHLTNLDSGRLIDRKSVTIATLAIHSISCEVPPGSWMELCADLRFWIWLPNPASAETLAPFVK